MAQPYVGEIRLFAGNFAPAGWIFCDGSILPISENETLFNLIGTTYGGDGQSTFALPDLRGRVPIHTSNTYVLATSAGSESVTLTSGQIPAHNHPALAVSSPGSRANPTDAVWAGSSVNQYSAAAPSAAMTAASVAPTGGNQPHDNMLPYLAVNYIFSLYGIFPSQA